MYSQSLCTLAANIDVQVEVKGPIAVTSHKTLAGIQALKEIVH